jgi:hypothetical protein
MQAFAQRDASLMKRSTARACDVAVPGNPSTVSFANILCSNFGRRREGASAGR